MSLNRLITLLLWAIVLALLLVLAYLVGNSLDSAGEALEWHSA